MMKRQLEHSALIAAALLVLALAGCQKKEEVPVPEMPSSDAPMPEAGPSGSPPMSETPAPMEQAPMEPAPGSEKSSPTPPAPPGT